MNDQGYTIDIQELAYLLVKRWYLILGCTVIMGIAGYAFGTNSDQYTATQTLVITPSKDTLTAVSRVQGDSLLIDGKTYDLTIEQSSTKESATDRLTASKQLAPIFESVLTSDAILQQVVDDLDSITVEALKNMITVSTDATPMAVVTVKGETESTVSTICEKLVTTGIKRFPEIAEAESVTPLGEMSVKYTGTTSNTKKNALIFAVLGFVLSVVVVIVRRLTDDTVRTGSDIVNGLGMEVLGVIPTEEGKGVFKIEQSAVREGMGAKSVIMEAYRALGANLVNQIGKEKSGIVVFAAPDEKTNSVSVVQNLAFVMMEMGRKVLVIDAELRNKALTRESNKETAEGFAEWLLGETSLQERDTKRRNATF